MGRNFFKFYVCRTNHMSMCVCGSVKKLVLKATSPENSIEIEVSVTLYMFVLFKCSNFNGKHLRMSFKCATPSSTPATTQFCAIAMYCKHFSLRTCFPLNFKVWGRGGENQRHSDYGN